MRQIQFHTNMPNYPKKRLQLFGKFARSNGNRWLNTNLYSVRKSLDASDCLIACQPNIQSIEICFQRGLDICPGDFAQGIERIVPEWNFICV